MNDRLRIAAAICLLGLVLRVPTASGSLTHVRTLAGPIPSAFGLRVVPVGTNQALVSAPYYCSGGMLCTGFGASGAAYRVDLGTGTILQSFYNPTPALLDLFAFATTAAAGKLFIAAMLDDDTGLQNDGAVYVFDSASGTLTQTLARPSLLAEARYGYALDGDGTHLLVGGYEGATAYLVDATTFAVVQSYSDPSPVPGGGKSFGGAVALGSDAVIVAEPEGNVASTSETGVWPGTVHVFER